MRRLEMVEIILPVERLVIDFVNQKRRTVIPHPSKTINLNVIVEVLLVDELNVFVSY